jgi:hypothetical protein
LLHLLALPKRIMDYSPMYLPALRASSFAYVEARSIPNELMIWMARHTQVGLFAVAAGDLAVYLAQHRPSLWTSTFRPGGLIHDLVARAPELDSEFLLSIGGAALYLSWWAGRAAVRASQTTRRAFP